MHFIVLQEEQLLIIHQGFLVAVGEEISSSVLQYIENRKALGYVPNGADDMSLETIWVLQGNYGTLIILEGGDGSGKLHKLNFSRTLD